MVEFARPESAAKCLEVLQGKVVHGKPLVVVFGTKGLPLFGAPPMPGMIMAAGGGGQGCPCHHSYPQ